MKICLLENLFLPFFPGYPLGYGEKNIKLASKLTRPSVIEEKGLIFLWCFDWSLDFVLL